MMSRILTLLASRIQKREFDALAIDLDVRNIVLKDSRDVILIEVLAT
jgi:hypothetical protein